MEYVICTTKATNKVRLLHELNESFIIDKVVHYTSHGNTLHKHYTQCSVSNNYCMPNYPSK